MSQQIDLKTKSTIELKALAYDVSSLVQQYQQMLQLINQEIAGRAQQQLEAEKAENVKTPLQAVPKEKKEAITEAEVVQ